MAIEHVTQVPSLAKRVESPDTNKGDFGTVMVLAGGRGMAGAAALAAAGALRSGAGKVMVACPFEVQPTVAQFEPSYMAYPLQDREGHIDFPACQAVVETQMKPATVLAIGPGLGETDGIAALVRWVLKDGVLPTVVDADALNVLSRQPELLEGLKRPVVLTPHPKEFSRLTGVDVKTIQGDREEHAAQFAAKANVVLVLKGSKTVVTDGSRIYVNTTGNAGMATGGSGDVLTGVIAAMIAQKLPAFEAAVLGVYAHGLAGDIARDQNGDVGMIAGDIVDSLADAFFHLGAG